MIAALGIGLKRAPGAARALVLALFLAALAGCGASGPLLPEQTGRPGGARPPPAPEAVRVADGDTLYSIAFRYGLDWQRVAAWNRLRAPYTIHTGDWIRLTAPPDMRTATRAEPATASQPAASGPPPRAQSGPAETRPPTTGNPAPASRPEPKPADTPVRPAERAPKPAPKPSRPPAAASAVPDAAERSVAGVAWRWPTAGVRVVQGFSDGDTRKGILIAGSAGEPVRAAADGEVVYSGNGLIGYGELIILKHSDRMLSAYGHNRERLVDEGDRVRAGQQIGRVGRDERDREVLHFEIRRDGKPENPINFLPRR